MSKPVPRRFCCVCCGRPRSEADGQIVIRHGGYPICLCLDCIDDLKLAADEARAPMAEAADD